MFFFTFVGVNWNNSRKVLVDIIVFPLQFPPSKSFVVFYGHLLSESVR